MANYLYLPGASGEYVSTPDSAAVSVTGDIDMRVKINTDWTNLGILIAKWDAVGTNWLWLLQGDGTLKLILQDVLGGAGVTSTTTTGFTDDTTHWVRVTLDVDAGSTDHDVTFYTSENGTDWSQLGDVINTAGVAPMVDRGGQVSIGAFGAGGTTWVFTGQLHRAQIYDGIAGTLEMDVDFTDLTQAEVVATTFAEDSSNAATMTINGSAWTYVGTPESVAAVVNPANEATITWNDVVDEASYTVERSPDGSTGWTDVSGSLAAGTVTYKDVGLLAGTQYFYRVIATYTPGDGDPSASVNITTSGGHGMAWKPMLRQGAEYPEWLMRKMRRSPSMAAALVHAWRRGTLKEPRE